MAVEVGDTVYVWNGDRGTHLEGKVTAVTEEVFTRRRVTIYHQDSGSFTVAETEEKGDSRYSTKVVEHIPLDMSKIVMGSR